MKKIYLLASLILVFGLTACTSVAPDQPKVDSEKVNIEKEVKKATTEADTVENDGLEQVETPEYDLTGWRDFESKVVPVKFKYHKNWYYGQIKTEADFKLYRFAATEDELSAEYINPEIAEYIELYMSEVNAVSDEFLTENSDNPTYNEKKLSNGATLVSVDLGDYKTYRLVKDNQAFEFRAYQEEHNEILDKMISTLKFVE